jgi:hypothetical protein
MDWLVLLLALLLILLIISVVVLSLYFFQRTNRTTQMLVESNEKVQTEMVSLLSKLSGLIAAKDPLAYQAIQAMDQTHSPSPDPIEVRDPEIDWYIKQYGDATSEEELNDIERGALSGG